MENEITPKTFPKPKPHSLIASLPGYLKDHANYEKIQKFVLESFAGKCSHGEVLEWAECIKCQKRFANRRFVLRELGFKNPAQYMAWKKVHEKIKERMPLVDWKAKGIISPHVRTRRNNRDTK